MSDPETRGEASSLSATAPPPAHEVTEEMVERAIHAACKVHSKTDCFYPECLCTTFQHTIRAALTAGLPAATTGEEARTAATEEQDT